MFAINEDEITSRFIVNGSEIHLIVTGAWQTQLDVLKLAISDILTRIANLFGRMPAATHRIVLRTSADGGSKGGVNGTNVELSMPLDTADVELTRGSWGPFLIHELFHLWNGPTLFFEPEDPSIKYTPQDWFFEGFTTYYQNILAVQLGWLSEKQWIFNLEQSINRYVRSDTAVSIYEASNDKSRFRSLIYDGGFLVALAINAAIFEYSAGSADIDSFMRELYRQFSASEQPVQFEDIAGVLSQITRTPPSTFSNLLGGLTKTSQKIDIEAILRAYGFTGIVRDNQPALDDVISKLLRIKRLSISRRQVTSIFDNSLYEVGDIVVRVGEVDVKNARDLQHAARFALDDCQSDFIDVSVQRAGILRHLRIPIKDVPIRREWGIEISESVDSTDSARRLRQRCFHLSESS